MKANTTYSKKIADKYHNIDYYESNEYNIKNKEFLEKESKRLKTTLKEKVTNLINEKRTIKDGEKVFEIIKNIYEKNKKAAFSSGNTNTEIYNTNLLNLVASIPLLMVSYAKVRKNSGSVTLAHYKDDKEYEKLDAQQKNLINKTDKGADGINYKTFVETSILIKQNKYPWGTSRRIFIEKPGKPGSKRPLTIPLFMDRVVQEAIRYILVAIYEPYFDKMNCSFGFRPNRSVHDAIYAITNYTAQGLDRALEGDIKSAYDKVNKEKLIQFLGKKIKDKKFLIFIEERLKNDFYDMEKDIFIKDGEGIPQGGTDSPYFWNIYMLEFDNFIMKDVKDIIEGINIKTRGTNSDKKKIINNQRVTYANHKLTISKILTHIHSRKRQNGEFKQDLLNLQKTNIKDWQKIDPIFPKKLNGAKNILKECNINENDEKTIRKTLQKKLKRIIHTINNMPYTNQNKKKLRLLYCRYADDWIILTNCKEDLLLEIKNKISIFLKEKLDAILSEEKTLLTDIRIKPSHFLGFEIKTYRAKKIGKYILPKNNNKVITTKIAGSRVFALTDKQRLIDRLYIKGYCDKKGFPREITKLNNLEAFTIIDKINSVLLGITNYYVNSIRTPKTELSRWIYIIRFSCLKTLALKFKTSIKDIFEKFKPEKYNNKETQTIEDTVTIEINGDKLSKTWRLHTIQSLMIKCRGKKAQERKREIEDRFCKLYNNTPLDYEEKEKNILINSVDFLERYKWVNIRTQSSFELPCSLCGSEEKIEMHYVKHVRKTKYAKINKEKTWEQVMGIRNRRQIPVCRFCHRNIIHRGLYGGTSLQTMTIDKMYDNRIVNIESYIHKGKDDVNYKKSLSEKGWKYEKDKEDSL